MRKAQSWIDSDFGGSDGFDVEETRPKKRTREAPPFLLPRGRRRLAEDSDLWSVRHAPTSSTMLAVHPKKVEEVKLWLNKKLQTPENAEGGILLLKGPAGSGKTATVTTLALELGGHVQEWSDPQEVTQYQEKTLTFEMGEWNGEAYDDHSHVPYVSHTKAFKNFMLRANRYRVLDGLEESGQKTGGKLVLLEELPNFARKNPAEFQSILAQYQSNSRRFPLVIVISDGGKDDLARTVLPDDVIVKLKIDIVSFNSAAPTNLVKALKAIATIESRSGVRAFEVPDKEELSSLAESSGGDIRGAINALQFACLRGSNGASLKGCFDSSSTVVARKVGKGKKLKRSSSVDESSLASIGGKDPSLDVFHAIGKILYCKRQEESSGATLLTRPPLLTCPEEVLAKLPMGEDNFVCFLHQSYPDFFTKMNDLAMAADNFSLTDKFFSEWTTTSKVSFSEYGALIAVRGLCHWNSQVAKQSGMRTFHKPDWYQKNRVIRSRSEALSHAFRMHSLPRAEVSAAYAPMLFKFFPGVVEGNLAEKFVFPGFSRNKLQFPALRGNTEENFDKLTSHTEEEDEDFVIEEYD